MHIKPCCIRCLRKRFMNVNTQLLLEFFVIYALLWKKFNFVWSAENLFYSSEHEKKKVETLSRPDIGNSTQNRTMSGLQFFCFAWNVCNYQKSFIRMSPFFFYEFQFYEAFVRCTRRKRDKSFVSKFVSVVNYTTYRSRTFKAGNVILR